jgi:hypothetical protein
MPNIQAALDEDRCFSQRYLELEESIHDLRRSALLALRQTLATLGELSHDPASGKCIEAPDADDLQLAVLTVDDVLRRAKELEALYEAGFALSRSNATVLPIGGKGGNRG